MRLHLESHPPRAWVVAAAVLWFATSPIAWGADLKGYLTVHVPQDDGRVRQSELIYVGEDTLISNTLNVLVNQSVRRSLLGIGTKDFSPARGRSRDSEWVARASPLTMPERTFGNRGRAANLDAEPDALATFDIGVPHAPPMDRSKSRIQFRGPLSAVRFTAQHLLTLKDFSNDHFIFPDDTFIDVETVVNSRPDSLARGIEWHGIQRFMRNKRLAERNRYAEFGTFQNKSVLTLHDMGAAVTDRSSPSIHTQQGITLRIFLGGKAQGAHRQTVRHADGLSEYCFVPLGTEKSQEQTITGHDRRATRRTYQKF